MKAYIALLLLLVAPYTMAQKQHSFSVMETSHVRVATPGLFATNDTLILPMHEISDTEYAFPLPGGKVISPYGRRRGRVHSGIDIKTRARDTIRSAFDGVVRMSRPYSAYGNVIVVRHRFGLETLYSHNVKNLVRSGDTVRAGQPIALTGRTGRASTEHLHFETRVNGQHFDPNLVFDMARGTLKHQRLECIKQRNTVTVKPLPTIYLTPEQKKYLTEPFKCHNVSLLLQNVSPKEPIEL